MSAPATAAEVIAFWRTLGPEKWFFGGPEVDEAVRNACAGLLARVETLDWPGCEGALARLLLVDQMARNIFRDEGRAFEKDALARDWARDALAAGCDRAAEPQMRQFFYLPFMHSELAEDQALARRLYAERLPEESGLHAEAHEAVILRFGRFPWRNAALGRASTAAERAFLDAGAYGAVVRALQGGHDLTALPGWRD